MKSTHKCEVVEVNLEKHPNADTLSIVRPFGYTVIVKTDDWKNRKLGAYVVPDSIVNTNRPEFAFLKNPNSINPFQRIKVKKFCNVYSQGLLIPAPDTAKLGDDLADYFEITRYEESLDVKLDTDFEKKPDSDYGPTNKYDIDSFYRYKDLFIPNEILLVTEKIDGSNAFFTYLDGRMWAHSRSGYKKYCPSSLWWIALANTPEIEVWCKNNPGYRLYGEVYGNNRKMPYGPKKFIRFAAFDIMDQKGNWLPPKDARNAPVPWVPIIDEKTFTFDELLKLADGPSLVPNANHIREGVVVEPLVPRFNDEIGRVKLKIVSNNYLDKN